LQAFSEKNVTSGPWLRIAALVLLVAALGLPINDLFRYAILLIGAAAIFSGLVSRRPIRWIAAVAVIALAAMGHWLLPAPQIDEGHNIFVADGGRGALQKELPADAYRLMLTEFDATYPPAGRCDAHTAGCWRGGGFPDRAFAFSADGIYDRPPMSRRVSDIDFSDPVWLRLGAINDVRYNWYGDGDIQRNAHKRPWWMLLHRWVLAMPYFVAYRFPAEFSGSELCWTGEVLWEGAEGRFTTWRHSELACRMVESGDIGRMIFGVSIASPLTMTMTPPWSVEGWRLLSSLLTLIAVAAVALLVRVRLRQLILPATLIGLGLVVVLFNDASFLGGVHAFDGGDDGLYYEGVGRRILQFALAGDFRHALEGQEAVYYYGGPGLRYLRAVEHLIFGDTFLGYLSLMLALPFFVLMVFRRLVGAYAALALTLIFVFVPVGAIFGTTLFQYVKWAARGFADPAAAALFLAGLVVLIGPTKAGPDRRFQPALWSALLFALALWVRPNLAPGAAVLLGGAGLAALWQSQIARMAGLCIGFLPVFGMALHNWYFGRVFVLFSSNATIAEALPMPPQEYLTAFEELLRLQQDGPHLHRWVLQWMGWLSGPSASFVMVPFHIAAVAVLIRVVCMRRFDPWLRLISAAALALHPVAWFYLSYERYYFLAWFLTLLVCAVWVAEEGWALARQRCPRAISWYERNPVNVWLLRVLDRFAASAEVSQARR
jgi:hypothetical protein